MSSLTGGPTVSADAAANLWVLAALHLAAAAAFAFHYVRLPPARAAPAAASAGRDPPASVVARRGDAAEPVLGVYSSLAIAATAVLRAVLLGILALVGPRPGVVAFALLLDLPGWVSCTTVAVCTMSELQDNAKPRLCAERVYGARGGVVAFAALSVGLCGGYAGRYSHMHFLYGRPFDICRPLCAT